MIALLAAYTGLSPLRPLAPAEAARLLPGLWITTIFLCPFVVPFFFQVPTRGILDPKALTIALLKVLGFSGVSFALSAWVLRGDPGGLALAVRFHQFLLAFQLLLAGFSLFLRGIGGGAAIAQAGSTLAGLLMILTVVFANTALAAVADPHKPLVIKIAVWANPLVLAARSFLEIDAFRTPPLYGFSKIADYPFLYPAWKTVAGLYGMLGIGFGLLGAGLNLLLFQLPKVLRSRKHRLADERRRSQPEDLSAPPPPTDWEGVSAEAAPPAEAGPPAPGEVQAEEPASSSPADEPEKMGLGPLTLEREPAAQGFVSEAAPPPPASGGLLGWLDAKVAKDPAPAQAPATSPAFDLRSAFEDSDKDTRSRIGKPSVSEPTPSVPEGPPPPPPAEESPAAEASKPAPSPWLDQAAAPAAPEPAPEPPAEPAPAAEASKPALSSWLDQAAAPAAPVTAPEPPTPVLPPAQTSTPESPIPPRTPGMEKRKTTIRFLKIPKKKGDPDTGVLSGPAPDPEGGSEGSSAPGGPAPEKKKSLFEGVMAGWGEPSPDASPQPKNATTRKGILRLDLGDAAEGPPKDEEKPG
jgi:hypothetical protein